MVAVLALLATFLPSDLLILGGLPLWGQLRRAPLAQRALLSVNAAVVGLLVAALCGPVFIEGIISTRTMAVAAITFMALVAWRMPAGAVVVLAGVAGCVML